MPGRAGTSTCLGVVTRARCILLVSDNRWMTPGRGGKRPGVRRGIGRVERCWPSQSCLIILSSHCEVRYDGLDCQ